MTGLEILALAICIPAALYWPIKRIVRNRNFMGRADQLPAVAAKLGMQLELGVRQIIPEELRDFSEFQSGLSRSISHVMSGERDKTKIRVFDLLLGSGSDRAVLAETIIEIQDPDLDLPSFKLEPETVVHKVSEALGAQDIDFESHPEFSDRYLLRGESEAEIRRAFTPAVLDWFERHPGLVAEGKGDRLICYRSATLVSPNDIPGRIELALEASRAFST